MKSALCFESLSVTAVSNSSVCSTARERCEVSITIAQHAFKLWDSVNVICILAIDITVSSESVISNSLSFPNGGRSLFLGPSHGIQDLKSTPAPVQIRTLWFDSAMSLSSLPVYLKGRPSASLQFLPRPHVLVLQSGPSLLPL